MTNSQIFIQQETFGEPKTCIVFKLVIAYSKFFQIFDICYELIQWVASLGINIIIVYIKFLKFGEILNGRENYWDSFIADSIIFETKCVEIFLLSNQVGEFF